jgi:hypothetical protein
MSLKREELDLMIGLLKRNLSLEKLSYFHHNSKTKGKNNGTFSSAECIG